MALFQTAVLNKYLKELDADRVAAAYATFTAHFHDAAIQANIREAKEEQYQEGFLRDLFVNVLGYTLNPQKDYELTSEFKNEKGAKKADGAILQKGKALAVIELKGTDTTDLQNINTQAFNYKANHSECVYVVTSNFHKLRFFIDNAVEHVEFDLFTLSRADFDLLWLCLQRDNLLGGIPKKAKAESLQQEEKITKLLYKDYSTFKSALWQDLCTNHPEHDKLQLYKKSQKLLDRFLFVLFSEDKGLLPPNSIREIADQWEKLKDLDAYVPLYERFKKYFGYLNTGHKGKFHDIFAYNGGLFKPDELLDNVRISDEVLHPHLLQLSKYDFGSEVDVNILGHIFEHSLNEIENITAQLEGRAVDSKKTKRKKDGVFYTPKYITQYIVEHTVGRLCSEKKDELGVLDEEYAKGRKGRQKKTIKELDTKLDVYRDWLLSLTICDPACGSGAFLNQALDFLIAEHRYVDELQASLLGHSITFKDIGDHILERNIYGVDINEESVEIARLSLWLRTATKGRKLNDLSSNIKCGNSLIDDPAVAGDKAFDWKKEFPSVFAKGGFDVVIGNPPYGALIRKEEQQFYLKRYTTPAYKLDTYAVFIEAGVELVKKHGFLCFIVPYTWLTIDQHRKLREFVLNRNLIEVVNIPKKVFDDADLDTVIVNLRNQPSSEAFIASEIHEQAVVETGRVLVANVRLNPDLLINLMLSDRDALLLTKIRKFDALDSSFSVSQGYIPYRRTDLVKEFGEEAGNKIIDERQWHSETKHDSEWRQEIQGRDLRRYGHSESFQYVKYGKHVAGYVDEKYFTQPRILVMEVTRGDRYKITAAHVEKEYFNTPSIINIIAPADWQELLFALLAVINSRLITWYHEKAHSKANAVTSIPKILIKDIRNLPVPAPKALASLIPIVSKMHEAASELDATLNAMPGLLQSKYTLPKLSRNLENWPALDFKGFLKELHKAKVSLSLAEEAEWLGYFTEQQAKAHALQAQINKTDREIDALVYALYGLTEEEVRVVEGK